ncbi:MAG: thiamine-phosphate kinase [Gammaproteobacteria bacterium]|nr:thiamine-phosphate kinase [Gammaproteobacteria bacterium]
MTVSEFDLITQLFADIGAPRADVVLAVGDDCAVLEPVAGQQLAVTTDTLVEGVHFFLDVSPEALGWKAVAVNISDLAAMGARPAWLTLALTLPSIDLDWCRGLARGLRRACDAFGVQLVGGDTTAGPLAITIQAIGLLAPGQARRRSGACVGDLIYVTGTLGDAGLALLARQSSDVVLNGAELVACTQRLEWPQPRLQQALLLSPCVHAMIDISDGLFADLGHILTASAVGATIRLADLPRSTVFAQACTRLQRAGMAVEAVYDLQLAAGDDYELCFTIAPARVAECARMLYQLGCHCIGVIEAQRGLRCLDGQGRQYTPPHTGYDHFAGRAQR